MNKFSKGKYQFGKPISGNKVLKKNFFYQKVISFF